MKKISFTTTLELNVLVEGTGEKGYKPYETMNHDDPRFSDEGQGPEINELKVKLGDTDITKELDKTTIREVEEQFYEELEDDEWEEEYWEEEYCDDDDDWLEQARDELDDE